jgi:hypothetical protein
MESGAVCLYDATHHFVDVSQILIIVAVVGASEEFGKVKCLFIGSGNDEYILTKQGVVVDIPTRELQVMFTTRR